MNLSDNAKKLLVHLKKTGGSWDGHCLECLFPKPPYVASCDGNFTDEQKREMQSNHWQWEADCYGNSFERPVLGEFVEFKSEKNYRSELSKAYKELKDAGLADERNNGFNVYFFYPTK